MSTTKVTGMMQTSTKGGDISSASPCVIDTDGDYFDVTGTTNFAAFTVTAGRRFTVQFDGILIMTHHATNLDLPGGASITTAAGDVAEFFATGTNTVQCVNYTKADGTAVVAGASGNRRNFIIDGGMTQWPEFTTATTVSSAYTSALWKAQTVDDGTITAERSTDVPPAGAGHSTYSLLIKCTGTDGTIGAAQYTDLRYIVTGSDLVTLHQKQVTFSFWAKTASANSGDTYYWSFRNSGNTESYVQSFAPTSTWTQFTYTLTMDTVGTWLFTEADKGIRIWITLAAGTDNDDGTIGSWVNSNSERWASGTAISNFMDSTSNEFYITNVGLYLGSTAPTFLPEPIATIQDQVEYYIQHFDYSLGEDWNIASGYVIAPSQSRFDIHWRRKMRKAPTVTSTAASTFEMTSGTSAAVGTSINLQEITTLQMHLHLTDSGSGMTDGEGVELQRAATSTTNLTADARH